MVDKNNIERIILKKIDCLSMFEESLDSRRKGDDSKISNEKLQSIIKATQSCIKVCQVIGKKALMNNIGEDDLNALVNLEYVEDPDTSVAMFKEMMNIGFVASYNEMLKEAEFIFTGVHAMRSSSELPLIGLAASHLSAGNINTAVDILNGQALVINPDSDYAKGYLALSYKLMGKKSQSQNLVKELMESSTDPDTVNMVKGLESLKYNYTEL